MLKLMNKVAIVTGGIGGIGRGIVAHFLDLGAKVVVVDIVSQSEGDAIVAGMAGDRRAVYLQKDIAIAENAGQIVIATVKEFGALHILVNNAHASKQAPIMETTQEMWDLSLRTGMYATFSFRSSSGSRSLSATDQSTFSARCRAVMPSSPAPTPARSLPIFKVRTSFTPS